MDYKDVITKDKNPIALCRERELETGRKLIPYAFL